MCQSDAHDRGAWNRAHDFGRRTVAILDALRFVQDDQIKMLIGVIDGVAIAHDQFVVGDAHRS